MEIVTFPNKDKIFEYVVQRIQHLLNIENDFKLVSGDSHSIILPSDIGILVQRRSEAWEIKKLLTAQNIPAILVQDEKVLQTPTALELSYILDAALNPNLKNIKKALFTSICIS